MYRHLTLLDLSDINTRYQARLNAYRIFTLMEFYTASLQLLWRQVFHSINGYYWYLRLWGYEIDAVDFKRKSFGNTYAPSVPMTMRHRQGKRMIEFYSPTGPAFGRHSSN